MTIRELLYNDVTFRTDRYEVVDTSGALLHEGSSFSGEAFQDDFDLDVDWYRDFELVAVEHERRGLTFVVDEES